MKPLPTEVRFFYLHRQQYNAIKRWEWISESELIVYFDTGKPDTWMLDKKVWKQKNPQDN